MKNRIARINSILEELAGEDPIQQALFLAQHGQEFKNKVLATPGLGKKSWWEWLMRRNLKEAVELYSDF